ncbi:MAG: hypothetical protein ABIA63_03080 [bacterium]
MNILGKKQVNEILFEQGFKSSEVCTTHECMVETGKIIGVEQIVVGSVALDRGVFNIDAWILDVETGKTVRDVHQKKKCNMEYFLIKVIPKTAQQLIPGRSG